MQLEFVGLELGLMFGLVGLMSELKFGLKLEYEGIFLNNLSSFLENASSKGSNNIECTIRRQRIYFIQTSSAK